MDMPRPNMGFPWGFFLLGFIFFWSVNFLCIDLKGRVLFSCLVLMW